jgi:hypothetical protein
MNTIYFPTLCTKQSKTFVASPFHNQVFKQQKPSSVLQEDYLEDDFIDGDFTKKLIISTLNNWSRQHFKLYPYYPKRQYCPSAN